jgi:16S rRNA (uracil1498-N3)-methyltransferase
LGERVVRNDEAGGSIPPRSTKNMYRFYSPEADFTQGSILISDPHEIHHIKNVLRLKKGTVIQIFNGSSQQADVIIEEAKDEGIRVRVGKVKEDKVQRGKLILACAPPKKGKFEFIIEKCTELGVDEIIPLKTKRTEVVFSKDRIAGKLNRFESVAVNAAKQSKRLQVPKISPMMALPEILRNLDPQGLHVFPSLHHHPQHMAEVLSKADQQQTVTVFIGPEGDFTADEVDVAIKHGCVPVSLGDTVLKVETAAIAAIALVKFLCRR